MSEYNNNGILFKNFRKNANNHPDYQGTARVTCRACGHVSDFALGAWIKMGRRGKFMSLGFSPPREQTTKVEDGGSRMATEESPEQAGGKPIF